MNPLSATYSWTQTKRVCDVYTKGIPKPLAEYRWGPFRPPKEGETYLEPSGKTVTAIHDAPEGCPRIILEALPKNPTVKEIYGIDPVPIPEGWEFVRFGPPKKDDCWLAADSFRSVLQYAHIDTDLWRIVVRRKASPTKRRWIVEECDSSTKGAYYVAWESLFPGALFPRAQYVKVVEQK